jgi:hypothetical protein
MYIFYACCMLCSSHTPFVHPKNIWWRKQIMKLLTVHISLPLFTFFIVGPKIHLSTLFSNILNLYSYIKVKEHVLHNTERKAGLLCEALYNIKN